MFLLLVVMFFVVMILALTAIRHGTARAVEGRASLEVERRRGLERPLAGVFGAMCRRVRRRESRAADHGGIDVSVFVSLVAGERHSGGREDEGPAVLAGPPQVGLSEDSSNSTSPSVTSRVTPLCHS